MNQDLKKFSLVTYLTGEDFKLVRDIQKEISITTGSQKCLVDWLPHITIGDGPMISESELPALEAKLQEFVKDRQAITVSIKGFGGIDNWKGSVEGKVSPYVIWLDVAVGGDLTALFNDFRESVTSQYEMWLPRTTNYVPHITLAFCDLGKEGYKKGMKYLSGRSFEGEFIVNHIALVECYGEGNMTSAEYKRFYFK